MCRQTVLRCSLADECSMYFNISLIPFFFSSWAVIIVMSLREKRISTSRDAQMDNSITFCHFKQLRGFLKVLSVSGNVLMAKKAGRFQRDEQKFLNVILTHARFLYKKSLSSQALFIS